MLTAIVVVVLFALGMALLAWDRKLASKMSPSEREQGRRDVARLYGSWPFLAAFVSGLAVVATLVSGQWLVLGLALLASAVTVPLAVREWRSIKGQS